MRWVIRMEVIAANPQIAHYHYLLAMASGRAGDQRKAKRELQEAYRLDESSPDVMDTVRWRPRAA